MHSLFLPIVVNLIYQSFFVGVYLENTSGYQDLVGNLSPIMFNIRWDLHEQVVGEYTWDENKKSISKWAKQGNHSIILNIKGCPLFYRKNNEYMCSPPSEEHYNKYANFILEAIRYYSPDYIEIWNEPDISMEETSKDNYYYGCWGTNGDNYRDFVNFLYPIIKTNFPNVKVLAGALSGENASYLENLSRTEFDILSYHVYLDNGDDFYYALNKIDRIHQVVNKPVIITETSLLSDSDPSDKDFKSNQANYLKFIIDNHPEYLLGIIWYTLSGNGWKGSDLYYNGETPAYQIYKEYNMR